jgi:predicted DCC family thiol-disulfide oxidoreductase YuxK
MVRAAVSSVFLIAILNTSFSNLGHLPATILRPAGIMQLLSWRFYDHLLTPQGMTILKWTMVLSLAFSTIGYLTPLTTKTSALLVLFYQGLLRSLGHFNHDEMIGIYYLIILAFSPCGDGFSVDSLPGRRVKKPEFAYGFPILLMWLLMAWVYFSSALIKLRVGGLAYFSADNLPTLAIMHSLDNLHDTQFRFAFWLPAIRQYLPLAVGFVLLWELLFPLAVFWKRVRWYFLGIGLVFHLSTLFLMNIFFPYQLAMYLVFIDWTKAAAWVASTRIVRRPSVWWRNFRSVPEEFSDLRIGGLAKEGVLLWDGDCGFCARMVGILKRLVGRPFVEKPYQSVEDRLPAEVSRWLNRQAFWVDATGRVTGGSTAVVELLANSGRPFLAAVLASGPVRPLLWFGYRIIVANRGILGKFISTRDRNL